MKQLRVQNLGGLGVNEDLNPISLPPEQWTVMSNVRSDRGRVRNFAGHKTVTACAGTFYYLLPVQGTTAYYWYFCSGTAISEWDGSTCTDVTRAAGATPYTATATDRWNGGVLHGIPVLNNGKDSPQFIQTPGTGDFTDMIWTGSTTWTTQGVTAKVIRPYRNFLIALDTTESGSRDPHVFRWSDAADPGSMPASWDETDATNLSGKTTLSDTNGFLVDCLPLGQDLIVYKEDAIYRVSYVGPPNVFRFDLVSNTYGMRAQGCAVDIGGAHVVLSHNGVYIHNGSSITPLAYGKVSESLFGDLSATNYERAFLVSNPLQYEVWIVYPDESSTTFANKAVVHNHKDDTWTRRSIPSETANISLGVDIETAANATWGGIGGTWGSQTGVWGQRTYNPTILTLHGVAEASFYKFDVDQDFAGVSPTCRAERTSMPLGGTNTVQTITAVYPEMRSTGTIDIYVGSQFYPRESVTWSGPFTFDPNSDVKVDCLVTGALFGVRFQTVNSTEWQLTGYTLEYEEAGLR